MQSAPPSILSVSVIICSCNRAAALKLTLEAFRDVIIPRNWQVEMIVVDNASIDDTSVVVRNFQPSTIPIRYVSEAKRGKGNALNTGVAAARGEVLLFTDDDVRPARDWIEQLALPLFQGRADAVGGTIVLAPHLLRPWLRKEYMLWLAWCETPSSQPLELIGANMGFRRSVLEQVPAFDPELGPGAAGLGEDTMFGWQVSHAGLKIKFIPDAVVVHHPDESRLRRSAWLGMAKSHGRKNAYILHHWKHEAIACPHLKSLWLRTKLTLRRFFQPPGSAESEGCARWEMSYVGDIEMCRAFQAEKKRSRNYAKRGLRLERST